jgi:uncharacterized repeat protein (TIGR04138 family)
MTIHPKLAELVRRDPRYAAEAYDFVFKALTHTQELMGRRRAEASGPTEEHHVSGPQLLHGIRDYAHREFGLMARTVFRIWGINSTGDFGEIVFNLVEVGLMSKTAEDNRHDFVDVYDLDQALVTEYHICMEEDAR